MIWEARPVVGATSSTRIVFGSAARGTDFDPARSDADFLVEFDRNPEPALGTYFGLKDALERLLERKVDLMQAGAVRNPFLLAAIDREREILYAS